MACNLPGGKRLDPGEQLRTHRVTQPRDDVNGPVDHALIDQPTDVIAICSGFELATR